MIGCGWSCVYISVRSGYYLVVDRGAEEEARFGCNVRYDFSEKAYCRLTACFSWLGKRWFMQEKPRLGIN